MDDRCLNSVLDAKATIVYIRKSSCSFRKSQSEQKASVLSVSMCTCEDWLLEDVEQDDESQENSKQ